MVKEFVESLIIKACDIASAIGELDTKGTNVLAKLSGKLDKELEESKSEHLKSQHNLRPKKLSSIAVTEDLGMILARQESKM